MFFLQPQLTTPRMITAVATALAVDVAQWLLGVVGFLFLDEILDVAAAIVITWAIGFHPLLLPTFLIELIPVADLVPTWTGCTLAVLALKKRSQAAASPAPPPSPPDTDNMKRATVIEEPPMPKGDAPTEIPGKS